MYKMTCSLLEQWRRATDDEAGENAFQNFLDTLERKPRTRSKAMQAGIDFEDAINRYVADEALDKSKEWTASEMRAITSLGNTLRGGAPQVRCEMPLNIGKTPLLLVGVADYLRAGVLFDIKRVQRYEYGKYAESTQHPMYMELFPEATVFRYLIFDGYYCYREEYRRGDYRPIEETAAACLRYLDDAGLMEIYQKNWRVQA